MADTDYIFKLVVVGNSGVGKTNLVNRYVHGELGDVYMQPTTSKLPPFSIRTVSLKGKVIKARIWDTMGQERFGHLTGAYYRGALGALAVYDVTERKSFQRLEGWIEELRESVDSNVRLMVIGNKTDLDQKRAVTTEEGQALAEKQNCPFMETSAVNFTNVTEAFNALVTDVFEKQVEELGMEPNADNPRTPAEKTTADSKMSCTCL